MEIVSRLIDGKFPGLSSIDSSSSETEIVIKKADFSRGQRLCIIYPGGGITVTASKENSYYLIHSIASELGENTRSLSRNIRRWSSNTSNSRYLTEVLNIIDDEITFSFNGKLSPCHPRADKNPDYTHIIMPLKS